MEQTGYRNRRSITRWIAGLVLGIAMAGGAAMAGWYWMVQRPYCVRMDCRGRELDIRTMKRWEEQQENGSMGILRMAGWRLEQDQTVVSVSTGRKTRARVVGVWGSMELTDSTPVLTGRYGLAVTEDYCVLSEELAGSLFGSVDVAGECVKTERGRMTVAGVIKGEDEILMIPVEEGMMEYLAVEFRGRMGAEGKIRRLMEE